MKRFIVIAAVAAAALLAASCSCSGHKDRNAVEENADTLGYSLTNLPEEPIFDIVTTKGTIRVKLYSKTPKHRDNFVKLVKEHYYDGVLFHRVIDGFVIQAGDPLTKDESKRDQWGTGGPGYTVPAEIVPEYYHKRGAIAAARKGDAANPKKASHGSQFYLVQDENNCLWLDGEYTVFGETVQGFDVIDRIAAVKTDEADRPLKPVKILSVTLSSDQTMPDSPDSLDSGWIEEEEEEEEMIQAEEPDGTQVQQADTALLGGQQSAEMLAAPEGEQAAPEGEQAAPAEGQDAGDEIAAPEGEDQQDDQPAEEQEEENGPEE